MGASILVAVVCSPVLVPSMLTGAITSYSMLSFWTFMSTNFRVTNIVRGKPSPVREEITERKGVSEGLPSRLFVERAPEIKEVREEQKFEVPLPLKLDQKPSSEKMDTILGAQIKMKRLNSPRPLDFLPQRDTESLEIPPAILEYSTQVEGTPEKDVDVTAVSGAEMKKQNLRKKREAEEHRAREVQEDIREVKEVVGLGIDMTASVVDQAEQIVNEVFDNNRPKGTEVLEEIEDVERALEITKAAIGIH